MRCLTFLNKHEREMKAQHRDLGTDANTEKQKPAKKLGRHLWGGGNGKWVTSVSIRDNNIISSWLCSVMPRPWAYPQTAVGSAAGEQWTHTQSHVSITSEDVILTWLISWTLTRTPNITTTHLNLTLTQVFSLKFHYLHCGDWHLGPSKKVSPEFDSVNRFISSHVHKTHTYTKTRSKHENWVCLREL